MTGIFSDNLGYNKLFSGEQNFTNKYQHDSRTKLSEDEKITREHKSSKRRFAFSHLRHYVKKSINYRSDANHKP